MMGRIFFLTLFCVSGIALVLMGTSGRAPLGTPGGNPTRPYSTPPDSLSTDFSDYIWPTDAGTIVTSSFAEYRRSHFHGGIDISTGDITGYRVFASRSGYIAHISVSPIGYGKMLYVRHKDGYLTTYAHLARFADAIQARVDSEQHRLEKYPVEIDCAADEFPVRQGEVIAFTGETGVGSPHLHFEIRNPQYDFINPFLSDNLVTKDDIAPTPRGIAISPLGEGSTVDGKWQPRVLRVHRSNRPNTYHVNETIHLTGDVGFSLNIRDRINGSRFTNGVYRNQLYIEDSLLYSVKLDWAPSRDAQQIGLYFDWDLLSSGRFERLYMNSSNRLFFYSPGGTPSGVLRTQGFEEGQHSFRIVSADFHGNEAVVTGTVVLNHPPTFTLERDGTDLKAEFLDATALSKIHLSTKRTLGSPWLTTQLSRTHLEGKSLTLAGAANKFAVVKVVAENQWGTSSLPRIFFLQKPKGVPARVTLDHQVEDQFVRMILKTDGMFTAPPQIMVYEGNTHRTIAMSPLDADEYMCTFRPLETYAGTRRLVAQAEVNGIELQTNDEFDLYPIVPGRTDTLLLDGGNLVVLYGPSAAFNTIFLRFKKFSHNGREIYSLLPENTVLNEGITVALASSNANPREGLFFSGTSSWVLIGKKSSGLPLQLKGYLSRTLGDLTLMVDDSPPSVTRLRVSGKAQAIVSFRFGDDLSGVDYDEVKMYIDGHVVIPEIDGEHHRIFYKTTRALQRGTHQLAIRLSDRLGNIREVERRFSVR